MSSAHGSWRNMVTGRISKRLFADQERDLLRDAMAQVLSRRQQRIVQWTCEGWTVAEIADEMGLAPARVSDEKYKAIRKLRSHFCQESCG